MSLEEVQSRDTKLLLDMTDEEPDRVNVTLESLTIVCHDLLHALYSARDNALPRYLSLRASVESLKEIASWLATMTKEEFMLKMQPSAEYLQDPHYHFTKHELVKKFYENLQEVDNANPNKKKPKIEHLPCDKCSDGKDSCQIN